MAKKQTGLTVSLEPTPKAAEAISLLQQAQGITITDKVSHEACRTFLKGAKALKREIVEHYDAIKKPLNAAKSTVLDMERRDLGPVEQAISVAERLDTQYVRQQQELEQREADERRRQAEADEQKRRDKEAKEAEAQALKIEASLSVLSPREDRFVFEWLKSAKTPSDAVRIARLCGFADPVVQASRLLKSGKISTAIANAQKAAAIRVEAEAKKAAPIVVDVAPVQSQIGSVSGSYIKTYYDCDPSFDLHELLPRLADEFTDGVSHGAQAEIEKYLRPAIQKLMDARASDLKNMFSRCYPMCRLVKTDKVIG